MVTLEVKNNPCDANFDDVAELINLLSRPFLWGHTKRGYEYWEEVNSNLREMADGGTQAVELILEKLPGGDVALNAASKGIEQTTLVFHKDGTTHDVGTVDESIPLERSGGPDTSILVRSP